MKLSQRLSALAGYVTPGTIAADIGTDHGYLPIFLTANKICPKAIAADINKGPLEAARANVALHHMDSKIDLRLGNGLQVLNPGDAETIIIAGMGGGTIRDILSASPTVATVARRLIMQPMADEAELRKYLITNGWSIIDEELLQEDERLYLILVAERGTQMLSDPILFELGPCLVNKKHPLLKVLIDKLQQKYSKVLQGLGQSKSLEAKSKAIDIEQRLAVIKDIAAKLEI